MKPLIHIDNLHLHINIDSAMMGEILKQVNINTHKLNHIEMKNAELVTKLAADSAKLDKIITEISALKDKVNADPDVPQDVVDAINGLDAKLQSADDLNDDAPVVEPPVDGGDTGTTNP